MPKKNRSGSEVERQFYQSFLEQSGLNQFFEAPSDRGGFDFAFQLDEILGGIRTARTPVTDDDAVEQAEDSFSAIEGRRITLSVDFEYQRPGDEPVRETKQSDPFWALDPDDILEAYYEMAGDFADEAYAAEGTSGGFVFSVGSVSITLA